jgi:branched-chain amino acid transport system substrate-binding protein
MTSICRRVLLLAAILLLVACGQPPTASTGGQATASGGAATAGSETAASAPTEEPATTGAATTPEATLAGAMTTTPEMTSIATTTPEMTSTATAATAATGAGNLSGDIPVGFVYSMTGAGGPYGPSQKNGSTLAIDEINNGNLLGGAKIKPIFEDDASKPEQAVQVFTKLINDDKVVAIVGPTLSNSAKSSDPVAQENKTVVLGVSNTAGGITEIGDYVFRDSLPEAAVIPNTVKVAKDKLGLKKVAVMYGNDDAFTKAGYDVFQKALQANGVEILDTETFAKGDTDFTPQLTKIKGVNPDAIVVSALAEEGAGIMTQARQLGIQAPFIGGNGFNSPQLAKLAGPAAEGAISGAAWHAGSTAPRNQAFVAAYQARFGAAPDQFAAQAYEGTYLIATAIKNAGSTEHAAIRDALGAIKNFEGVLGSFSFEGREPKHTPVVQVVKNGKFEVFQ